MVEKVEIPIVLLTGFLGSGKTTLLSGWLRSPEFDGAMVIVNELGEVGLDHTLLATASEAPLVLENGCACCAASDDLIATLERLFWDRLHRKIPRFSWLLIETTGIADPEPIVEMLKSHRLISERYRIAGVVSTFDAVRGAERYSQFPEVRRQIETASVVVITKTDLVDGAHVERALDLIDRSAPGRPVLQSYEGVLSADALLTAIGGTVRSGEVKASASCAEGHEDCDEVHIHAEHRDGVSSAFLAVPAAISWAYLLEVLPVFLANHNESLLRMKGFVELSETGGYYSVQAMPREGIRRAPLPVGPGSLDGKAGFTLISHGVPADDLARDLAVRIGAGAGAVLSAVAD